MNKLELSKWIKELMEKDELWRFYKSKEFRHLKKEIMEFDHNECRICKKKGIITKGTIVHHVQYVRTHPELALSKYYTYQGKEHRNLITVCETCHNQIHNNRNTFRPARLYVVTGLPGSGKTTYVEKKIKSDTLVYDADKIIKAIRLDDEVTGASKRVANKMLNTFVEESMKCKNIDVYVIRTSPNQEELELFNKYKAKYIEIEENIDTCKDRRLNIAEDEWTKIQFKHKMYLKLKDEPKEDRFAERW